MGGGARTLCPDGGGGAQRLLAALEVSGRMRGDPHGGRANRGQHEGHGAAPTERHRRVDAVRLPHGEEGRRRLAPRHPQRGGGVRDGLSGGGLICGMSIVGTSEAYWLTGGGFTG